MTTSTGLTVLLSSVLVTAAFAAGGCGSSDSGDGTPAAPAASNACAQDNRKDIYTAGLSKKTASAYAVKVMDATPAPPAKLNNQMTLQLLDAGGNPVDGATVSVVPFMPDHGHGSAIKPTVTAKGGGVYDVNGIYLVMPGLWRLTVTVQMPNVAAQDVAFQFCIDG